MHDALQNLVFEADLDLTVDGAPVRVTSAGGRVIVEAPSVEVAGRLLRSGPFAAAPDERLERVHTWLLRTGQTAELRVDGTRIARLGPGARPGALSRLLRLRRAEIDTRAALRQTVRERPGLFGALLVGTVGLAGALLALWRGRE